MLYRKPKGAMCQNDWEERFLRLGIPGGLSEEVTFKLKPEDEKEPAA